MYEILKPNVLITVHGERRVIREHSRFAKSCGISHVVMPRNGDVLLLNGDKIETVGEVPTDILGVDRNQITSINSQLVKNRKRIAYNGSVFITAVLNENWQPEYLDISSIDILDEETWTKLAEEIRADMLKAIPEEAIKLNRRESAVKEYISAKIRKRIYNQTGIKPVVFMHFHKKKPKRKRKPRYCKSSIRKNNTVIAGVDTAIHKHKALAHDMHAEGNALRQRFVPQPMLRSSWPQLVIPVFFSSPLSFLCSFSSPLSFPCSFSSPLSFRVLLLLCHSRVLFFSLCHSRVLFLLLCHSRVLFSPLSFPCSFFSSVIPVFFFLLCHSRAWHGI